jgi:RAD51-like protein 1
LDQTLHGGLRIGTITELVGTAGTGKTQLALQTTITTALSYNISGSSSSSSSTSGGGTIWIDTEQKLSLARLQEMTIARCRSNHPNVCTVLENITIHSPSNVNEFIHVLDSLEDEIIDRNTAAAVVSNHLPGKKLPVRLIVIDSIAAVMGREWTKTTSAQQQQQAIAVMQIAQVLKRYANHYTIAILIINQVTSTTMVHSSTSSILANNYPQQQQQQQHHRAALGMAWHHCVTTRIELQQHDVVDNYNQHRNHIASAIENNNNTNNRIDKPTSTKHQGPYRHAKVVKSLTVEPTYTPLPFQITVHGIVDDLFVL